MNPNFDVLLNDKPELSAAVAEIQSIYADLNALQEANVMSAQCAAILDTANAGEMTAVGATMQINMLLVDFGLTLPGTDLEGIGTDEVDLEGIGSWLSDLGKSIVNTVKALGKTLSKAWQSFKDAFNGYDEIMDRLIKEIGEAESLTTDKIVIGSLSQEFLIKGKQGNILKDVTAITEWAHNMFANNGVATAVKNLGDYSWDDAASGFNMVKILSDSIVEHTGATKKGDLSLFSGNRTISKATETPLFIGDQQLVLGHGKVEFSKNRKIMIVRGTRWPVTKNVKSVPLMPMKAADLVSLLEVTKKHFDSMINDWTHWTAMDVSADRIFGNMIEDLEEAEVNESDARSIVNQTINLLNAAYIIPSGACGIYYATSSAVVAYAKKHL